ncbi:GNAT family N-acetyltransferase [Sporolactobacillus sp. CPB3-1]|uniref:GNAT family N-acetyltransferase n=1 Tax=Sporolactobacillus mangiferae TaxID=2940498 RepID=A0ABT0M9V0_9BACL|nr:GNAT family N-acetyltransferase [Sporolactobacillus mangiferae]MCL1631656.1 GNAT family N-acetyltransferase [Sporolactobacillus mangiferae]
MTIRFTTDAALIARLNEPVQTLHAKLYPEHFKPYQFEKIRDWFEKVLIQDEASRFLVTEDEEGPCGYAWIQTINQKENPFKKASVFLEVHQFCIASPKRRKGLGTALMNRICQYAREQELNEVILDYWANNEAAEQFYRHQQFTVYRNVVHLLI